MISTDALDKKTVCFLLSVDTEEEFEWGGGFPQEGCSVENVQCIPEFQEFCQTIDVRPTYLVDYPVAFNPASASVMKTIAESGAAEIGAHLHPWCTPPIEGLNGERESHVVNLPIELVEKKLKVLTETIKSNIGVNPTVFRTGRWGINAEIMQSISKAGYKTDSSIFPYYANEFFSCENSCDTPYWPDFSNPDNPGSQRQIMEIPITAGFNRPDFPYWGKIHKLMASKIFSIFHPIGLAWRSNTLKKIYLSPELSTTEEMIALVDAALESEHVVIHMFLHSSTLLLGENEFTNSEEDGKKLFMSIKNVVRYLNTQANVEFCTLSEAAVKLQRDSDNASGASGISSDPSANSSNHH